MMMSANNGSSWVDISGSLPSSMPLGFQIWDIVASGNDIIVAAVTLPNTSTSLYIGKVFKSSNNGSSWVDISNGLPNTEIITRLIKKGNVLFAGTAFSGVYKNGTLLSDETSLADEASISVYPNPASDLITVDLLNKNKAPEYYEISNTLGALVQGDRIENSNTFSINVNNLPHGVYFLSLFDKDGSITLSKKRFLVN